MNNYNLKIKNDLMNVSNNIKIIKKCFEKILYHLGKYMEFIDNEVLTKYQDSNRDSKLKMFIETLISNIYDSISDINFNIKPSFMFYLQNYTNQILYVYDLEKLLTSENVLNVFKQITIHELNSDSITVNVTKNNSTLTFNIELDLDNVSDDMKLNLENYLIRLISFNLDKEEDKIEINFSTEDTDTFTISGIISGIIYIESDSESDNIGYANVPKYDIGFGGNYSYRMNIANSKKSPWYDEGNLPIITPIKFNMKEYMLNNINCNETSFINSFGNVIFYIPGIQILYDPVKITLKMRLSNIFNIDATNSKHEIFKFLPPDNDELSWFMAEWTPYINNINNLAITLNEENELSFLNNEDAIIEEEIAKDWNIMNEKLTNNDDMHYLLANISNYILLLDKYIEYVQKRKFIIN